MKKILFLLTIMLAATASSIYAQNSNKSGVFLEAGFGWGTGSFPSIIAAKVEGTELKIIKAKGFGFEAGTGYRYAINKANAIEMKLKYEAFTNGIVPTSAIKIMPGWKWYSPKSLGGTYFGVNLGVVISSKGSTNHTGYVETAGFLSPMSTGFVYEIELGKCLNRNQYIGLFWDEQNLKGNTIHGIESRKIGMVGVQYGYRF